MIDEHHQAKESEGQLQQEKEQLERLVSRSARRRAQLMLMLVPFILALGWTGYNFCIILVDLLRNAEPTPKILFELGFWGVISGLVFYVVAIVARERGATIERAEDAEKRLLKVNRRIQQLAFEGVRPQEHAHPGATPARQPHHPTAAAAPARAPAHAAPAPAKPQDRGQIVLDLDAAADTKECPMCAELVRSRAKICRFCRHEFAAE